MPEAVWSCARGVRFTRAGERLAETVLSAYGWAMQQSDVEKEQLHEDHDAGLDEKRRVVAGAKPVEQPDMEVSKVYMMNDNTRARSYLRILATSIISGMSSEKPALERFLLIDQI